MKYKKHLLCSVLSLLAATANAEVIIIDVELSSTRNLTPETALRESASAIYNSLNDLTERTEKQQKLWDTFDYLINTAAIDDPNAIKAITEMSPKRNGTSTVITRKSPSTIPVKGIGKRLSALRKSTRQFNFLDSVDKRSRNSDAYNIMPGLIKYNTESDSALEAGGLLDQRLSSFVTGNGIWSKQSDTTSEAGFDGKTAQATAGADYRINNKTFAGAALSYTKGHIRMTQGGLLTNDASALLIYATRSINDNWFTDATINLGKRNFEMDRSINFTLNSILVNTTATSNPEGSYYGFSLGTGYDLPTKNGHSISLLASFNYSTSEIDAFEETGNSAYNLAVNKQTITSKIIDAGIEWRQAISLNLGVLLPQISLKWTQELEDKSDPVNAYFVTDPSQTTLSFETGNKDQGHMNLLIGATMVLPKGLAAFAQFETQHFVDDYQQTMLSIGGRKEF